MKTIITELSFNGIPFKVKNNRIKIMYEFENIEIYYINEILVVDFNGYLSEFISIKFKKFDNYINVDIETKDKIIYFFVNR